MNAIQFLDQRHVSWIWKLNCVTTALVLFFKEKCTAYTSEHNIDTDLWKFQLKMRFL